MSIIIPKTQAASTKSIRDLEALFDMSLPNPYVVFVNEHDGAKPEANIFKIDEDNSATIDCFISCKESGSIQESVEGFPPKALPIARDGSGNFFYINLANGAVFFWDHEKEGDDQKLADSFDEFLEKLQPFDLSQIKLRPGQVNKVWVNPNFKPKF